MLFSVLLGHITLPLHICFGHRLEEVDFDLSL
jgi:hypothetical protein